MLDRLGGLLPVEDTTKGGGGATRLLAVAMPEGAWVDTLATPRPPTGPEEAAASMACKSSGLPVMEGPEHLLGVARTEVTAALHVT